MLWEQDLAPRNDGAIHFGPAAAGSSEKPIHQVRWWNALSSTRC